jgi:phosphoribosylformylglycinamidine synthase
MLGMVGLIERADQAMTQWFRQDGDDIILMGSTREDLGGSEYLKIVHAREQGSPPFLNAATEQALHDCVLALIREGLVQSAHDCSDGGLAVTLAESCMSGPDRRPGAVVRLSPGRLRTDAVLFGETQSRVVLSAKPGHRQAILDRAARLGVPAAVIGAVGGESLIVYVGDERSTARTVDVPVAALYDRWAYSIERTLNDGQ